MQRVAFSPARPATASDAVAFTSLPPLALYVHVPWCLRKCPYCDFNSHEAKGEIPERAYVDALIADLEATLPAVWGRRVHAIFFGGGTPSLLSADALDRLLAAIRARLPLEPDAEVTLEANPGTAEQGKFRGFRDAGVNRLSLGIQSFDDDKLRALGRVHGADEARRAAALAVETFGNVNLDLMYGLPGQSLEQALADIHTALAYAPTHVSAYHLTIEPNTAFAHAPPALPPDDEAADMQEAIESTLALGGYDHYETSAFALPGRQCRHNLNYWRFGDYLGIGAGAHAKMSFSDRVVREARHRSPKGYVERVAAGDAVQERRCVTAADLPGEFAMNALRLTAGVERALFAERTGLSPGVIEAAIERATQGGLLERDPLRLAPTRLGQRFLNDLVALFLEPRASPEGRRF